MSRCKLLWLGTATMAVLGLALGAGSSPAIEPLLVRIRAIGKEGSGNVSARQAVRELTQRGPEVLIPVLTAMKDANPVALNYLRAVVDTIAEKTLSSNKPLPASELEKFVTDTRHSGVARRLAYEWLIRVDATAPERLLPGMLDDPGAELRRDAVALLLREAQAIFDKLQKNEKADPAPGIAVYRKALHHARDRDQVMLIAQRLKKLGVEIDLTTHFGFVTRWHIAASFDNHKGIGYAAVYPPEKGVDLKAVYDGKQGQKVRWREVQAGNLGLVDFNREVAALHGVVAYAHCVVVSPVERPVELRAASNNAIKIFLNGQEIFGREEYHHGMQLDQHVGKGRLKAGRNEVLVKVCQNEQTEDWAQRWSFQLRLCDSLGAAVPVTVVSPAASNKGE